MSFKFTFDSADFQAFTELQEALEQLPNCEIDKSVIDFENCISGINFSLDGISQTLQNSPEHLADLAATASQQANSAYSAAFADQNFKDIYSSVGEINFINPWNYFEPQTIIKIQETQEQLANCGIDKTALELGNYMDRINFPFSEISQVFQISNEQRFNLAAIAVQQVQSNYYPLFIDNNIEGFYSNLSNALEINHNFLKQLENIDIPTVRDICSFDLSLTDLNHIYPDVSIKRINPVFRLLMFIKEVLVRSYNKAISLYYTNEENIKAKVICIIFLILLYYTNKEMLVMILFEPFISKNISDPVWDILGLNKLFDYRHINSINKENTYSEEILDQDEDEDDLV